MVSEGERSVGVGGVEGGVGAMVIRSLLSTKKLNRKNLPSSKTLNVFTLDHRQNA